jgi:hypothetical protein
MLLTDEMKTKLRIPYALRRVPETSFVHLLPTPALPSIGDVALAEVMQIGKNTAHLRRNCGPAQRSPFDTSFTAVQSLFTGTIAKVTSLLAIVIGGYGFAHGEPGAKNYQVVNSDIEAERDHLRVGDHIVRVLTMKEGICRDAALVLDALLKIPANFYVVTEWTPLPADKARKEVNKRRRHFNMSKTGFVSQMGNDATQTNPRDVLVDESKQADVENLGDCLRAPG